MAEHPLSWLTMGIQLHALVGVPTVSVVRHLGPTTARLRPPGGLYQPSAVMVVAGNPAALVDTVVEVRLVLADWTVVLLVTQAMQDMALALVAGAVGASPLVLVLQVWCMSNGKKWTVPSGIAPILSTPSLAGRLASRRCVVAFAKTESAFLGDDCWRWSAQGRQRPRESTTARPGCGRHAHGRQRKLA